MSRWRRDDGVTAVLLCIVLTLIAIPIVAYGVTSGVRGGFNGELQRAADAGALAGASAIPLADPTQLATIAANYVPGQDLSAVPDQLLPTGYCVPDPANTSSCVSLETYACDVAMESVQTEHLFTRAWGYPDPAQPCVATPLPDKTFFQDMPACVTSAFGAQELINGVVTRPFLNNKPLPGSTIASMLTGQATGPLTTLLGTVYPQSWGSVLPALYTPQMQVTVRYWMRGPFDGMNPGDDGKYHLVTATAVAQREFKNVVVVPMVGPNTSVSAGLGLGVLTVAANADVSDGQTIDLNPALASGYSALKSDVNALTANLPAPCNNVLPDFENEMAGLVDPGSTGAPTAQQVLQDAATNNDPVDVISFASNVVGSLQVPFFDFAQVCLSEVNGAVQTTSGVITSLPETGSCASGARGSMRARLVS